MGIWMNGKEELKEAMTKALNDVEGDFTREELVKACEELGT